MTYAGLTISDKPALMEAKERGKTALTMAFSDRVQVVDIDIALAQIAAMEKAEKPMTWNERINQMTVEEKAKLFDSIGFCMNGFVSDEDCNANKDCMSCALKWLDSPYTEGETK